ncbi:MAG: TonB-dependent receptor [Haliscomenobacter sp.]|uniref:SusC/RagA family TonB-linked outer membrane protein n=1 Tax=Haliscomenobacter sp. TaxID=2717303 RepID=UPI0029A8AA4C|nr:TonB-dependent receptor [Haliscomenobacter sp.]MDX2069103.1 TonB-dependent receptor [Haliscomenobacter sp.]
MKQHLLALLLMLCGATLTFAQRTISGKVTAENGEALIGASILVKGASGTATDVDGTFSLNVPANATILEVSYTGYASQEITLGASNVVNITLKESITQLTESIITGYGASQIKRTLTGNIAKLKGEDIQNLPVPSVEQGLQGRTAGVFVESVNGKPGGAIRVRVRGASSITASSQPLYVIDGVPITVASQNQNGAALNPLADLNFNDIESLEVLKDASAGAIYGARAANGVVLITTKKGRSGRTNIEFDIQRGIGQPSGYREFLNTAEFIQYYTEAANNTDVVDGVDPNDSGSTTTFVKNRFKRYSGYADYTKQEIETDWQDEAFRTANSTQASLSASGGNDKTRFFASASLSDQEGILVGNAFQRLSTRLNLSQKASERLTLGMNMSLSRTYTNQVPDDNAFSTPLQLIALAPITPVRDLTGRLYDRPTATYYNGLIDVEDAKRDIISYRTLANATASYQIVKNLTLTGEVGADIYNLRDNLFASRRTFAGQGTNGTGNSLYAQVVNINTKAYLNYNGKISERQNLGFTVGTEFQRSRQDRTNVTGTEFPVDDLKTLASSAKITVGNSTLTEFSFLSYFGRVNYDFDRRFLLTLSGRVDGSSRFGINNRFGFFPAASAGWVISEEGFMENSPFSFFKIRASYGLTGNAEIGNFQQLGLLGSASYNGVSGLSPNQIANDDLQWEKTGQLDIGIDFAILKDRISAEIDYYNKNTFDLLLNVPVPGTSGFRTQTQNIGRVENRGFEFVLNGRVLDGAFKWSTALNLAFNQNEVKELAPGQDIIDQGSARLMNVVKVGAPLGVFYGAEYAGVDPQNGDALWYLNTPGKERETTNDFNLVQYIELGSPQPTVIGGFTNTFSYKGLELSVMFQGVGGNSIHNGAGEFMSANANWFDNQTKDQLSAWKKVGDITNVPQARLGYVNGNQSRSSRYLEDGDYIRLRSATLSYQLPSSVLGKLNLSKLRIYLTGQNLLVFTKYTGWDPEVSSDAFVDNVTSGVDFYAAPQPRTVVLGATIGF